MNIFEPAIPFVGSDGRMTQAARVWIKTLIEENRDLQERLAALEATVASEHP